MEHDNAGHYLDDFIAYRLATDTYYKDKSIIKEIAENDFHRIVGQRLQDRHTKTAYKALGKIFDTLQEAGDYVVQYWKDNGKVGDIPTISTVWVEK